MNDHSSNESTTSQSAELSPDLESSDTSIQVSKKSPSKKNKIQVKEISRLEKFAIINSKGKQFTISPGCKILLDTYSGINVGDSVSFNEVLFYNNSLDDSASEIGTPYIEGKIIQGKVTKLVKAKKVIIFKKVNRNGYTKKQGHRQKYLEVVIDNF